MFFFISDIESAGPIKFKSERFVNKVMVTVFWDQEGVVLDDCCHIHLYSPDLAPSDFFLFTKLKEHLKGVRFNSTDEAKHAAKTWLRNHFAEFIKNGWKQCLGKCIDRDGGYVEKQIYCK